MDVCLTGLTLTSGLANKTRKIFRLVKQMTLGSKNIEAKKYQGYHLKSIIIWCRDLH